MIWASIAVAVSLLVAPAADPGESARVLRVTDGDTFVAEVGGREERIRVLGIDSCEMSTPAGPVAKEAAQGLFTSASGFVTLRREPSAPDRDRYGRLLRYVALPGGDFGQTMVSFDHTGVYAGRNDASKAYLASLRELDWAGRSCAGAPPEHTQYVPVGGGDDDDRKSRFCRRHWYC